LSNDIQCEHLICLVSVIFTDIEFIGELDISLLLLFFFGGGIIIGNHNHAVFTTVRITFGFAFMFIEYTLFVY